MIGLKEKMPEVPVKFTSVLCSNDGFQTVKVADFTMSLQGRFCVLHNFLAMNNGEFVPSNEKNVLFDFQNRETGAQFVEGADSLIVLGNWWIYGDREFTVNAGTEQEHQVAYYDRIQEFFATLDRDYTDRHKLPATAYTFYHDPAKVELRDLPVKRGVSKKAVQDMTERNDSFVKVIFYQFKALLEKVRKVTRILGIVCAVGAILYSILLNLGVITLFAEGAIFTINHSGTPVTILAVVSVLLTLGSLIFSGGLLGCLKMIGGALSIAVGSGVPNDTVELGPEYAYEHNDAGLLGLLIGFVFTAVPFIIVGTLIVYLPIVPIISGSMEKMDGLSAAY